MEEKNLRLFLRQKAKFKLEVIPIKLENEKIIQYEKINTETLDISGNGVSFVSEESFMKKDIRYFLINKFEVIEGKSIALGYVANEIKIDNGIMIGIFFLAITTEHQDIIIHKVNELSQKQVSLIKKGRKIR